MPSRDPLPPSAPTAKKVTGPWRPNGRGLPGRARGAPPAADAVALSQPWLPIVGWSLVLHAALLAAALGLAFVSVYAAGFFALFAGVILMIMAPVWFGAWSLSLAAILAAIGAIGAALALDRARELGAGEIVRLESVAAMPRHATATGFVFADARVAVAQAGSYRHTSYRTHGSGPNVQVSYFVVAPLVPRGWRPGSPVPAWAACHATYEGDCLRSLTQARPAAAVVVRRYDRETYYTPAIAAAQRSHGLQSLTGAPVVMLTDDPAGVGGQYWTAVWLAQPAAFLLWLLAFAGWGVWRRLRRPPASA